MSSETGAEPSSFLSGKSRAAALLGLVALSLYVIIIAAVPIRSDNDCFWQLKSGWYISNFGLPENDVFSYTAADHEWHNHEWLAQVLMYKAYQLGDGTAFGGWRAVIAAKSAVIWATYAILYLLAGRISRNWWIALLVTVLAVAIGRRMFYPRPPVITNLILAGQLLLLVAVAEGWIRRGWVFVLVPVIALWTNLHGGWIAGGVVLAAWAADQFWSRFRERFRLALPLDPQPQTLAFVPLVALGVLCLLATLCNPYTYHLYALPGRVLGDRALVSQIFELQSPNFYYVIDFELVVLATAAIALMTKKHRPRLFELLIWLFFVHQAIQHVRHLSLFSIAMVPLTARLFGAAVDATQEHFNADRVKALIAPLVAAALAVVAGGWVLVNPRESQTYFSRHMSYLKGQSYVEAAFPFQVCNLIELAEPRGRMFNQNSYAGYLIWRLAPEPYKVFSDPRFDIFGGSIWTYEQWISAGIILAPDGSRSEKPYFEVLLDEYDIQWVITKGELGLAKRFDDGITKTPWALAAHWPDRFALMPWAGWQIWVRDVPENEASLRRLREAAPLTGAIPGPAKNSQQTGDQ